MSDPDKSKLSLNKLTKEDIKKTFSLLDPDFRLLYTFQNSIDMPND